MFEPKSVVEFVLDDTNFTKNDRDKTLLLDENEALKKHPSASKIVHKGVKKVALGLQETDKEKIGPFGQKMGENMAKYFGLKSAKTPPKSTKTSLQKCEESRVVCLPNPRNSKKFSRQSPSGKGKKGAKGVRSKGVDDNLVPITNFFKKEDRMEQMKSKGGSNPTQEERNFKVGNQTIEESS